jgi:hypothetical protein
VAAKKKHWHFKGDRVRLTVRLKRELYEGIASMAGDKTTPFNSTNDLIEKAVMQFLNKKG